MNKSFTLTLRAKHVTLSSKAEGCIVAICPFAQALKEKFGAKFVSMGYTTANFRGNIAYKCPEADDFTTLADSVTIRQNPDKLKKLLPKKFQFICTGIPLTNKQKSIY